MNRALILLFLAQSASSAVAQTAGAQGNRPAISLPAGLTEVDILRTLIPDYEERLQEYLEARETGDAGDHYFSARLTGVVETDFGWGKRKYLIATASGGDGMCGQCQFSRAGVLDRAGAHVLYRFPGEERGEGLEGGPRLLRVSARDKTLAVALGKWSGSEAHWNRVDEVWYWPRRQRDGSLSFEEIWRGEVGSMSYGNWGSSRFDACGDMFQLKGGWFYVLSTYYGGLTGTDNGKATPLRSRKQLYSSDWTVGCDEDGIGPVEIRLVQRFASRSGSVVLKGDPAKVFRVDFQPSQDFPFNLPIREGGWLRKDPTLAEAPSPDEYRVLSPSRHLAADATEPLRFEQDSLVVRRVDSGEVLRTIRLHHGDDFHGVVRGVGWSRDESRVFIVITFGNQHTALLSFSVEGNDDYWEGLIGEEEAGWAGGFVMEPVKGRKPPT
jgi:hypothetical protein